MRERDLIDKESEKDRERERLQDGFTDGERVRRIKRERLKGRIETESEIDKKHRKRETDRK